MEGLLSGTQSELPARELESARRCPARNSECIRIAECIVERAGRSERSPDIGGCRLVSPRASARISRRLDARPRSCRRRLAKR